MYPEEGKKIAQTKNPVTDDCNLYYSSMAKPLPPPRHKQETVVKTNYNLIEL